MGEEENKPVPGEFFERAENQMKAAGVIEDREERSYRAARKGDPFPRSSKDVKWIEWGEDGRVKDFHLEPAVGLSMLMSPFNAFFTWQTTTIVDLIEANDKFIHFKTENSEYKLFIGNNELFESEEHKEMVFEFIHE